MSESNSNVIPAINAVDGFNPADFVRTTVGEEGENDLWKCQEMCSREIPKI